MKNFKELRVWQKGMDIAASCFGLVNEFPSRKRFGLSGQITRAALSILSNIAEGSSRSSLKEYSRFLEISLGSCFEWETQLLISQRVGYGNQLIITNTLIEVREEQKMLTGFLNTLSLQFKV